MDWYRARTSDRRARVSAEAARLARDPVAGPYLFGNLATSLEQAGQLHKLADAVETAAGFAEAERATSAAAAAEVRETGGRLSEYVTRWPGSFGKDDRDHLASAAGALGRVADRLDGAAHPSLGAVADPEAG